MLGSKVGLETMARTLPVDGWITTTAPSLLTPGGNVVRACSAAFCREGSTVRVTLSVVKGCCSRKSNWLKVCGGCWCGLRYVSYCSSIPAVP